MNKLKVGSRAFVVRGAVLSFAALKEMSGTSPGYAGLSSELDASTVVDGLTIETRSFQGSPTAPRDFNLTLQ